MIKSRCLTIDDYKSSIDEFRRLQSNLVDYRRLLQTLWRRPRCFFGVGGVAVVALCVGLGVGLSGSENSEDSEVPDYRIGIYI